MSDRAASWRIAAIVLSLFLFVGARSPSQLPPLRGYLSAHDPSTIIQCKDRYYIFSTGEGILSKSSADKVFWTPGPPVFSSPPTWATNAVLSPMVRLSILLSMLQVYPQDLVQHAMH